MALWEGKDCSIGDPAVPSFLLDATKMRLVDKPMRIPSGAAEAGNGVIIDEKCRQCWKVKGC